jgi:serine/threonine protein kinase
MGEVYRARDCKLGRDVAVKVLSEAFAQDPERLTRFEREARALASLNHPGVAAICGFETAGGVPFLVLELVSGETLEERLGRGRLPIDEALRLAAQIAEALEAAHEHGIIHRDLKPSNVKVTPEEKAKVLDFGLAKTLTPGTADSSEALTRTSDGTRAGAILGTPAYMSPEQARGKPIDKRTDLWSFGCLVYALLTGSSPFAGETSSDSIAATPSTCVACSEGERSRRMTCSPLVGLVASDVKKSVVPAKQKARIRLPGRFREIRQLQESDHSGRGI